MPNGDQEERLTRIEKRISGLEDKPKDFWDKFQIIAALLIPAAVMGAGYIVSAEIKEAEIKSAEEIAEGNRKVAEINASVSQAELIHSFIESLTKQSAKEKTIAIEAMSLALPEDVVERLLLAVKEDKSISKPVKQAAEKILQKLRNGQPCNKKTDCLSNYCYPVPPGNTTTGFACLAKQNNCAFAGSDGHKYGQAVKWENAVFQCYRPPSGPADWLRK